MQLTKNDVFNKIVNEKQVIDPVIWILKIERIYVDETHKQYVQAMAKRWKNNSKVMQELKPYFLLWKIY